MPPVSHNFFILAIMLKIEMKSRIAIFIVVACCGVFDASGQVTNCKAFHNGVFHVFQATSGDHYVIYRDDQTEREVVAAKGDSTVWNIQWLDDCNYTLQYVSGNVKLTGRQANFVKKHKLFYHLSPAGKDYCLYVETIDGPSGILIEKDTMRLGSR
jgi:hypothetical protein